MCAPAAILVLIVVSPSASQTVNEFECRDQPVRDILLSLGALYGRSILPDETVTGRTSCYIHEATLQQALSMFLPPLRLYAWEKNGLVYVSKIRVSTDRLTGLLELDAEEVDAERLIQRLAEHTGISILSDELSGRKVTLHGKSLSLAGILRLITRKYPECSLEETDTGFIIRRVPSGMTANAPPTTKTLASDAFSRADDEYTLVARSVSFRDAIATLMKMAGKEVVFRTDSDSTLTDIDLEAKSFDEMLRLLLSLGGSGCSKDGGTFVVYDLRDEDLMSGFNNTVVVPLAHISAQRVPALLPTSLASTNRLRVDTQSNSVIMSGKPAEIAPIRAYLEHIDRPPANRDYYLFELSFILVDEFLRVLPEEFGPEHAVVIPGSQSFVLPLSKEKRQRLRTYIASVDRAVNSEPFTLRYIRVSDLIERLPPGVNREEVFATTDPSTFFFVGDEKKRDFLRRKLPSVDRPARQIRYELLVIQHDRGTGLNREITLDADTLTGGERNSFFGSIGKLLALKFDIVSAFGWLFALNLNLQLSSARARVLADTTLNGISGEQITFRNTNTYRYRDAVVNPDTGHLDPTGVVREITSGLIIGINGWVSGGDVITMDITSTVSARSADTSGSATALPPTSEKVITTHVRTKSGKPVVIGGLLERTTERQVDKTPWLGDLPVVGPLFQKATSSSQDSELSVYILPRVEQIPEQTISLDARLMQIYQRLIEGKKE